MDLETSVLLDGLTAPESPRWHDGKLWLVDILAQQVMTVDLDGHAETVVKLPDLPSGLGWLPDGRLLVVSMRDRRLLRLDPAGLVEAADLSELASGPCNDMVVDRHGRAYVGNIGFDMFVKWEREKLAEIVLVTPDGDARVVAREMALPNGSVITPDGRTLIVAESTGDRLTAFDIQPDGSLTGRRVWAQLQERAFPDGICLDAEGAIWVRAPGDLVQRDLVQRVREGGEVTHRFKVATKAIACMLGGPDRRTLFVLTRVKEVMGSGRVEFVQVDVPGAGLP